VWGGATLLHNAPASAGANRSGMTKQDRPVDSGPTRSNSRATVGEPKKEDDT
jgi:hypothetical protein